MHCFAEPGKLPKSYVMCTQGQRQTGQAGSFCGCSETYIKAARFQSASVLLLRATEPMLSNNLECHSQSSPPQGHAEALRHCSGLKQVTKLIACLQYGPHLQLLCELHHLQWQKQEGVLIQRQQHGRLRASRGLHQMPLSVLIRRLPWGQPDQQHLGR